MPLAKAVSQVGSNRVPLTVHSPLYTRVSAQLRDPRLRHLFASKHKFGLRSFRRSTSEIEFQQPLKVLGNFGLSPAHPEKVAKSDRFTPRPATGRHEVEIESRFFEWMRLEGAPWGDKVLPYPPRGLLESIAMIKNRQNVSSWLNISGGATGGTKCRSWHQGGDFGPCRVLTTRFSALERCKDYMRSLWARWFGQRLRF